MFPKAYHLQQREQSCEAKVKQVYPSGVYHPSQTIFEKIEEEDIAVPPELKYSWYRATFDIKVYYPWDGTNLPEKRDKLEYTALTPIVEHQRGQQRAGLRATPMFRGGGGVKNRLASQPVGTAMFCAPLKVNRGDLGSFLPPAVVASQRARAGAAAGGGGDGGEYRFRRGQ